MKPANQVKLVQARGQTRRLRALGGEEAGLGRVGKAYHPPEDIAHLKDYPQRIFHQVEPRPNKIPDQPFFV